MYAADTIVAVATPPGAGGIGIVRVSGPLTVQIAARAFRAVTANDWESHRLYHGTVLGLHGQQLDEALAVVMRAPHSYTGEDVLELHCHGSPVGLRQVLHAVLACGARLAEPGEFTRRAFLNGRVDLTQAEAIIELIRARNDSGVTMATDQLLGRLSEALNEIRGALIDIRAQLEVQIDFSDEEVAIDQGQLTADIERTHVRALDLLNSYRHGRLVRDGVRAVITGKPNVGKSSLLNALLGEERAIVTAIPGTTRDVVEETADFCGVPVLLSDTAGLRTPGDPVEAMGVERTRAKIAAADIIIAVFDASQAFDDEDLVVIKSLSGCPVIAALNKSDLPVVMREGDIADRIVQTRLVRISARCGTGLDELREAVVTAVAGDSKIDRPRDAPTVMLARHRDALEKAVISLQLALNGVRTTLAPELIAVDIQGAADQIGTITGAITSEDVLDRIFSEFCIGK